MVPITGIVTANIGGIKTFDMLSEIIKCPDKPCVHVDEPELRKVLMPGVAASEEERGSGRCGVERKGLRASQAAPGVVAVLGHECAVRSGYVGDAPEVIAREHILQTNWNTNWLLIWRKSHTEATS